jgi:hypothetical protein
MDERLRFVARRLEGEKIPQHLVSRSVRRSAALLLRCQVLQLFDEAVRVVDQFIGVHGEFQNP